jgi:adenylate kinase
MSLQNIIVFMGAPGSGKGTQTKLLSSKLGYEFFSTGELAREYSKLDSDFGRKIKSMVDAGIILPIDIIREIFTKKFESILDAKGVILDGFPRTLEQVQLLEELMTKYGIQNIKPLFLNVDREKLMERLASRAKIETRADDDPSTIAKRFDEYMIKTAPVKEYYETKGKLMNIDGNQTMEAVQQEILTKLGL